ncbi:MAG: cryptochrome/photolyase family protein [Bacteroidota bacterium]
MKDRYQTLRLVLGDQLNSQHSWFHQVKEDTLYVLMEVRQETDYVSHHIQKILGFFAAMRNFADELQKQGHEVWYIGLDNPQNTQSLTENVSALIQQFSIQQFEYQEPDEYRLDLQLKAFTESLKIPSESVSTEHFLCEKEEFQEFFKGKKTLVMESFYRYMRKKYDLLLAGGKPLGGKWNYDAENRKKLPRKHSCPSPFTFSNPVSDLFKMVSEQGVSYIGEVDPETFIWPTTREQSLALLDYFLEVCLPLFGTYQDAMSENFWSVYHARISFSLNTKILSPLEVVNSVIAYWENHQEEISLSQVEGFVRQIIGWREYMRGIYWAYMPEYSSLNYFSHTRPLPSFYWTGNTKMNCLHHSIKQSIEHAYAHHIQRLMVTGNFALLAGIDPTEVDAWYLGIYIDAIEWVEITNTRGMSQFADGGIVGTKPYISSANYIKKMSDYCSGCAYDAKLKVGEGACPFNSLYWDFYDRNRPLLEKNPRVSMMYRVWDKMDDADKQSIRTQAQTYLNTLEEL